MSTIHCKKADNSNTLTNKPNQVCLTEPISLKPIKQHGGICFA